MTFKDLDIFVFTHRDFEVYPENPAYKLVTMDEFDTSIPLEIVKCDASEDPLLLMEHGYSEGARLHYVWKHVPLKRYVGTSHYRRYFDFFDDIPDMDAIFKDHDAILPNFNLGWSSVGFQYASCHCWDDMELVGKIISELYPEYIETFSSVLSGQKFYPCNIFILTREMFDKYCSFVYGVLGEYDIRMGFKSDEDILAHVKANAEKYVSLKPSWSQNGRIDYQARIQAFLMERLSTVFFCYNIKNPYMLNMILTEVHEGYEYEYYNYKNMGGGDTPTVGVYMIVKDEDSVISNCIDSVLPFADEVVVVDTGSSDKTKEIVSGYNWTSKVSLYNFTWTDDFSEARNFALSKVSSDYSFQIDADEVVDGNLSNEVNVLKNNRFNGKHMVNVCLLNINENGVEWPIFNSRMFVHRSLNPVWRNKVHEKLYCDVHEGQCFTIPMEKGVVRHKKHGGSLSNFGKYMEMYYRMLNEGYDYYGDGHFYYYFYLTNLWNDIPMCKRMLSNVFKPDVLELGDDVREIIRIYGNVTEDEWFTMNAIAQPYTEYDKHQIDLLASRSLDNNSDTSRYLASEWFVKHAGMEKFEPYMEKAFGIYLDELSKALRPKDYIETYKLMADLYPHSTSVHDLQEYVDKLGDVIHNTLAVVFDVDGFDTTYHYASRCFTNVMVVSKRDNIKLSSNYHSVCGDEDYAINNSMYVKQIPSMVVLRNNGHVNMENFKAVFNHLVETNNQVRGYIGFKREYVLNGNEFSVNLL